LSFVRMSTGSVQLTSSRTPLWIASIAFDLDGPPLHATSTPVQMATATIDRILPRRATGSSYPLAPTQARNMSSTWACRTGSATPFAAASSFMRRLFA
jgi:hypothetical protein